MKHGFIKAAAGTPDLVVADCTWNQKSILAMAKKMTKAGAKLLVFPELALTGYTCQDLFLQRQLLDSAWEALLKLAKDTKKLDALIFVGLPVRHKGKLYNVAAALNQGRILGLVPKTHIPNYNEFYEQRHFASGEECMEELPFEDGIPFGTDLMFVCEQMPALTVAAEICEDLWAPDPPCIRHAMGGAKIIVNLSASNEMIGKDSYRRNLVCGSSGRLICGYIYASAGEGESTQDLVFGGHDLIAENGTLLAQSRRFENGFITADLDVQRLEDERRRISTWPAEERGGYQEISFSLGLTETVLSRSFARHPFVPEDEKTRESRCEEILQIQSMGLKKRMRHVHAERAVVGLSGGLDSTLALLVMAKTFDLLGMDRKQIHCVTMPCLGTTDRTYHNACTLAEKIGASLTEINIREAVELHFRDIGHDPEVRDVTYENSQARERTQILMDIANQENALLVGTGDLSELALGWATYNGDHMSMYGVNASVPKTLVRHLVRYYADTCGDPELSAVLLDILDTPVSPELLPPREGEIAQKTEDLVGPYELHDFFLYYFLRQGYTPDKILRIACLTFEGEYDRDTILKWLRTFVRRFFSQQFKRSCLPDGPKVGSVALSPRGDLRMPSDASAAMWLKSLEE